MPILAKFNISNIEIKTSKMSKAKWYVNEDNLTLCLFRYN